MEIYSTEPMHPKRADFLVRAYGYIISFILKKVKKSQLYPIWRLKY